MKNQRLIIINKEEKKRVYTSIVVKFGNTLDACGFLRFLLIN